MKLAYIPVLCLVLAGLYYGAQLFPQVAARDIAKACKQDRRFTVGSESFSCSLEKSR